MTAPSFYLIQRGCYDIPFPGGSTFPYNGDGIYVAWEFSRPNGALTSPSMILSTTAGTSLPGVNGQDSIRYLLCMITVADTSDTDLPTILTESRERPETRFGSGDLKDSVSVVAVHGLGMTAPKFQSPHPCLLWWLIILHPAKILMSRLP